MSLVSECLVIIVDPGDPYYGQIAQPTIYDHERGVYFVTFPDGKSAEVHDGACIGEGPPEGIVFEKSEGTRLLNAVGNLAHHREMLKALHATAKNHDLPPRTREMAKQDFGQLVMKGNSKPVTGEFIAAINT